RKHARNARNQYASVAAYPFRRRTDGRHDASSTNEHRCAQLWLRVVPGCNCVVEALIAVMADKPKNLGDAERLTAREIFESAAQHAREELKRPWKALAFSGIAGGLTMGLTGLSTGLVIGLLGHATVSQLIAATVYPIGFLAVVIGRAQLFTENTLYPVVLVLTARKYLVNTLKLWAVVYAGNWVGSVLFAALAVKTSALQEAFARR